MMENALDGFGTSNIDLAQILSYIALPCFVTYCFTILVWLSYGDVEFGVFYLVNMIIYSMSSWLQYFLVRLIL